MKQFSEACEQNKAAILKILKQVFHTSKDVLEIGSGTGQHAVYFAKHLSHLNWQPSDLSGSLSSIEAWMKDESLENLKAPVELDVLSSPIERLHFDAIFTANSLHIMTWPMVEAFFDVVGDVLIPKGKLLIYGPFSYQGEHISLSNDRFDRFLKQHNPDSGIRDVVDLERLAEKQGLILKEDFVMPVNNRCLFWQKS